MRAVRLLRLALVSALLGLAAYRIAAGPLRQEWMSVVAWIGLPWLAVGWPLTLAGCRLIRRLGRGGGRLPGWLFPLAGVVAAPAPAMAVAAVWGGAHTARELVGFLFFPEGRCFLTAFAVSGAVTGIAWWTQARGDRVPAAQRS